MSNTSPKRAWALRLRQQDGHRLRHSTGNLQRIFERFSPRKKSAKAPASAWQRFMALLNSTRAGSRWTAPLARHDVPHLHSHAGSEHVETEKTDKADPQFVAAVKRFCSWKTKDPCGTRIARAPKIRLQNFTGRQWHRSPQIWNQHKDEIALLFTTW